MTIEHKNIDEILNNKDNPRTIKDENFKKLVKSIKEFPEMLEIRPIVIDENNIVLGGNMRLKACKEAGLTEVPTINIMNLTEEQKREFILKDNQSYGEWDYSVLKDWGKDMLTGSGFEDWELIDIFGVNDMESKFTAALEGSNFNPDVVDVDDYIKQNILFLNEFMIEFEDDEVKSAIRNLNEISGKDAFTEDLKKLILQYGKNSI
jgi:hypothetical protein